MRSTRCPFSRIFLEGKRDTFSPETGSVTGSSTAVCLKNTLPLVARNKILSNVMDFSLGTRPARNPNLICFDESPDNSFTMKQTTWTKSFRKGYCQHYKKKKSRSAGKKSTWSCNKGVSIDSPLKRRDSYSLCCSMAPLWAEWKNSPAWKRGITMIWLTCHT